MLHAAISHTWNNHSKILIKQKIGIRLINFLHFYMYNFRQYSVLFLKNRWGQQNKFLRGTFLHFPKQATNMTLRWVSAVVAACCVVLVFEEAIGGRHPQGKLYLLHSKAWFFIKTIFEFKSRDDLIICYY